VGEEDRKQLDLWLPPPLIDESELLVNDVMTWEAELGYFIVAMQRAGLNRETISEVLKRHKRVKLPPYEATRIYREFMDRDHAGGR
jgi:hypothetical protein